MSDVEKNILFIALVKAYDSYITPLGYPVKCWKSKLDEHGNPLPGWFFLGMTVKKKSFLAGESDEQFEISYHIPEKYWDKINVMKYERAPEYDGHGTKEILERLLKL